MWMALSKKAIYFMTAYGSGIDTAKRLLANSVFCAHHRYEYG